jgi:hypothetical protein
MVNEPSLDTKITIYNLPILQLQHPSGKGQNASDVGGKDKGSKSA